MFASHFGELAALCTAVFWTITALAFESAGRKVGSLAVNWIRLVLGLIFLSLFTWILRGKLLPLDASMHAWFWLSLSGFIGFALGDLFLFKAFVMIGSRISMLIMASVPLLTATIGWIVMGETLSTLDILGTALTIFGICWVVIKRKNGKNRVSLSHPVSGILFAAGGALGQAIGLVFSKLGMGDYNAFAATQIRIISGLAAFTFLFFVIRAWNKVGSALKHISAMKSLYLGSFFGPFLGVSFSLLAVQHTATGVASAIMGIVPVLIIVPAVIIYKEKVSVKEIAGAVVAVGGVFILFL